MFRILLQLISFEIDTCDFHCVGNNCVYYVQFVEINKCRQIRPLIFNIGIMTNRQHLQSNNRISFIRGKIIDAIKCLSSLSGDKTSEREQVITSYYIPYNIPSFLAYSAQEPL